MRDDLRPADRGGFRRRRGAHRRSRRRGRPTGSLRRGRAQARRARASPRPARPAAAAGPIAAHPGADRRAAACPRCGSPPPREISRFGLHRLHGAAPLPRLPRAVRARQGDLMSRRGPGRTPPSTRCAVARGRAAVRRRRRRHLRRARRAARGVRLPAGPVPHPAPRHDGRGASAAPTRSAPRRRAPRIGVRGSRTACSPRGWCDRCGRATRSRSQPPAGSFTPDPSTGSAPRAASPPVPASPRCCRSRRPCCAHPTPG